MASFATYSRSVMASVGSGMGLMVLSCLLPLRHHLRWSGPRFLRAPRGHVVFRRHVPLVRDLCRALSLKCSFERASLFLQRLGLRSSAAANAGACSESTLWPLVRLCPRARLPSALYLALARAPPRLVRSIPPLVRVRGSDVVRGALPRLLSRVSVPRPTPTPCVTPARACPSAHTAYPRCDCAVHVLAAMCWRFPMRMETLRLIRWPRAFVRPSRTAPRC